MIIPSGPLAAIAHIRGEGQIRGCVKFYPLNCAALVVAEITGLPETQTCFFSLHIHEGTQCSGRDLSDTLGHYNPEGVSHPSHAGDLPPLLGENGSAFLAVRTPRINVWEVIGHTVVIHEAPGDFRSQPAGNAGRKIACGVICRIS